MIIRAIIPSSKAVPDLITGDGIETGNVKGFDMGNLLYIDYFNYLLEKPMGRVIPKNELVIAHKNYVIGHEFTEIQRRAIITHLNSTHFTEVAFRSSNRKAVYLGQTIWTASKHLWLDHRWFNRFKKLFSDSEDLPVYIYA